MCIKYYKVLFLLLLIAFSFFYILYSNCAWFYQDDFSFLWEFKNNTGFQRVLNTHSRGFNQFHYITRFFSRNIYWFSLQRIFHINASLYYLLNFLIILLNTCLLFNISKHMFRLVYLPYLVSLVYFIGYPTISNFSWISNSQHLIGHLFVFLFLYIAVVENLRFGVKLLLLSVLFFIGIFSNAFFIFVLPGAIFFFFINKSVKPVLLLLAFGLIYIAFFACTFSITQETNPYSANLSTNQFISNFIFYTGHFSVIVALSIITITAFAIVKKDKLLITPIILSFSFFLPFAFLVYQKYVNYIALPFIFYICSLVYAYEKYAKPRVLAIVLILLLGINLYWSIDRVVFNLREPLGQNVRLFLSELNQLDLGKYSMVFIKGKENHTNFTQVPLWDIPPFWWHLGRGKALNYVFRDTNTRFRLYNKDEPGYPVIIVDDKLEIMDIQFPKD